MIYKDCEIYARVHETGSDLYSLTDEGELDASQDIKITHDDQTVVWYEHEWGMGEQFATIEAAKADIDKEFKGR